MLFIKHFLSQYLVLCRDTILQQAEKLQPNNMLIFANVLRDSLTRRESSKIGNNMMTIVHFPFKSCKKCSVSLL